MIRSLAYKTGIIIIVTLLIGATGGYSVYHHMCQCAGEISASILMEASCDHEAPSVAGSCCNMEESHSCCAEKPAEDAVPACHDDDCCQTSSRFFKINDSFQPGLEKILLKPLLIASTLLFFDVAIEEFARPSLNLINADLPPPDTGKQIILALHRLKLDPSLV